MAGSEITVKGSLFNESCKPDSLKAFNIIRDSSTGISLWTLWNFWKTILAEPLQATTSHMTLFFFFFAGQWGLQRKINLFDGEMVN